MIDIKPPEEEKPVNLFYQQLEEEKQKGEEAQGALRPEAYYLREISKTLKDILREMRKRKV